MSAGSGFMRHMVDSVKANNDLKRKRAFLRSLHGYQDGLERKKLKYNEASAEELRVLRLELKAKNQSDKKRRIVILFASLILTMICLFALSKFLLHFYF